ncbi:hypothetical protein GCM10007962_09660 [Yeosuana aromativorans]|uniref:Glycosyl transferase family 2 n=1 Tax=Yeosuana aromativorans TaxID=288019 RepID=A0A8J3BNZ8_9FLAO|nr:DapH/DapD/GlmU-related protein [Yeosuana aromativorans]GGK17530.1 hypothetical protein GCM10007962_09660 [Yeosuana aromativorans]
MTLSPVILFAYNRPNHIKKTLDALSLNPEAKETELFIFCDGPKLEISPDDLKKNYQVAEVAKKEHRFKKVVVTIHKENKGLANSIIDGVTEIIKKYHKVIVLEDDIVTSIGFLSYMNDALTFYENEDKVMHISGYMYPHKEQLKGTFFYNVPLCWGWATWERSWKHFNNDALTLWKEINNKNLLVNLDKFGEDYLSSQLANNISGSLNTWFIKWHASVLLKNGFTLFPSKSLVNNIGFDNSGVHNGVNNEFNHNSLASSIEIEKIDFVESKKGEKIIKDFYKGIKQKPFKRSLKGNLKKLVRSIVFKGFPELKIVLKKSIHSDKIKTYLGKNTKVYAPFRLSNSIIGNYTYISDNSVINNTVIGKFCSIGANFMSGRGIHPTQGISTHPMFYSTAKQNGQTLCLNNKIDEFKQITIGNDVFIGMNVTVLDGVTIGDGAVIGAGALVSKDIPPYAIAVGNPIKIIKYRFDESTITKLLKIKWWNFDSGNLYLIEKYFFSIDEFIKEVEKEN